MLLKKTNRASFRRTFIIVAAMLAANTSIANILVKQIALTTNAQGIVVKDDNVALENFGTVTANNSIEPITDTEAPTITTYVVQEGDNLSTIASKFNISVNTIRWANDLGLKATITPGQELIILPVTGIQYTVKKGDTISSIVKKFDANEAEVLDYNNLERADAIKVGMDLIIPDAEPLPTAPKKTTSKKSAPSSTSSKSSSDDDDAPVSTGRFLNPIPGSHLTQGLHAQGGVDFGAPVGTNVRAAASGKVIIAKEGGWNGGFGSYIVIDHGDGTQTLYAHLSHVLVSVGERVDQGDHIGESGNTGHSTGPHLHFEVHRAANPFAQFKVGTIF